MWMHALINIVNGKVVREASKFAAPLNSQHLELLWKLYKNLWASDNKLAKLVIVRDLKGYNFQSTAKFGNNGQRVYNIHNHLLRIL